jgi:hypothetical protein
MEVRQRTSPPSAPTKRALSPERRRLVELMQEIDHGRIKCLEIHAGEPVFSPKVLVEQHIRFGKPNAPNNAQSKTDFVLRKEAVQLFEFFDTKWTFTIRSLEVQNGLPMGITTVRPYA